MATGAPTVAAWGLAVNDNGDEAMKILTCETARAAVRGPRAPCSDRIKRRKVASRRAFLRAPLLALCAALAVTSMSGRSAEKTTILVLGDSLSSGYGLDGGQSWVDVLARDFAARGLPVELVNDSISGDTTAGGAARLPDALRRIRPDWVLIELGGNDGLRGQSLTAMKLNLQRMVEAARAAGVRPALLGMRLPPNYGERYTRGFERVYREVAADAAVPLLPFFIRGIEDDLRLFLPDRIHPNAAAQPIIARTVGEFLRGLL